MNKKKETIYLETSVISAYHDFKNQDVERKRVTRKFWRDIVPQYHVVISNVVFAELEETKDTNFRKQFLKFVAHLPMIQAMQSVLRLSQKYIARGVVPTSKIADATHLAVATLNQIDYLVSWNQKHITAPSQRKKILEFHKKHQLYIPTIATPDDFFE